MKFFLGMCLILGACMTGAAGTFIIIEGQGILNIVITALLWFAGTDMVCTVAGKPLVKAGPIARYMHPMMPEDE